MKYESPVCDALKLESLQMIAASIDDILTVDNPFGGEELKF